MRAVRGKAVADREPHAVGIGEGQQDGHQCGGNPGKVWAQSGFIANSPAFV